MELSKNDIMAVSLDDKGTWSREAWMRALQLTAPITRSEFVTFPTLIGDLAERFGAAPALMSEHQCYTYRDLSERANRYARWALDQGIGVGDAVCLLMQNCPEYMALWLGITRVGGIVALINTNLVGDPLAYSINLVEPKHIVVGADLLEAFAEARPRLPAGLKGWVYGSGAHDLPQIEDEARQFAGDVLLSTECKPPSLMDRALQIYTSGTTGLPKAANVSHFRIMQWSHWFAGMMDIGPADRMYNCLPMYHSIGGVAAAGATLVGGGSVVLRERFSAGRFWDDVCDWNCTLFQVHRRALPLSRA